MTLSRELLKFLTSTFTKPLSKDVWTALLDKYPEIKGADNVLVTPTMETGVKEDIKKKHGYLKTKEIFSFDVGLAEYQAPLLTAIDTDNEEDNSGPEPDDIKVMIEDALALLGNAVFRLNAWRPKRFSEYVTDLDKHLCPDSFYKLF